MGLEVHRRAQEELRRLDAQIRAKAADEERFLRSVRRKIKRDPVAHADLSRMLKMFEEMRDMWRRS